MAEQGTHEDEWAESDVPVPCRQDLYKVPDRMYRFAVAAILLAALLLRLWAIDFGLPHTRTRPDELPVVQHTAEPARGDFAVSWPVYPHSYIYVSWAWGALGLEVAQLLGAAEERSYLDAIKYDAPTLLLVNRILSALLGTLAVCLTIGIAESLFGRAAGLATGIVVATNFLQVRESHVVKSDIFLCVGVLLTFLAVIPLARRATSRRGALAGLAAGIAMSAKYPGILLAPTVYFASVMGSRSKGWRRGMSVAAIVSAIAAAGFFVATNPYLVFNQENIDTWLEVLRTNFSQLLAEGPETTGETESVGDPLRGNAERFERMKKLGDGESVTTRPLGYGFVFHLLISLRYGMGLLPTLLVPFALIWGIFIASVRARAFTWPACIFFLVYFGVFGFSPVTVTRYMTPLIPILVILIFGMGSSIIAGCAARRSLSRRVAMALLALMSLLLSAEGLMSSVAHNRVAGRTDTRVLASRWLVENTPRGSRVKDMGTVFMPYGRPQLPKGWRPSKAEAEFESLARDRVAYVVTHDHVLFSSSLDPERFAALEEHLELLAEFDPQAGASGAREDAIFERSDAYYIPIHGFSSVTRPGPLVRIYAFDSTRRVGPTSAR